MYFICVADECGFNDNQFFHYTSAITAMASQSGIRDVFVLTCPGLLPPAGKSLA